MRVASILLFCAVVSLASCHKNPVGTTKKPTELSDKGRRRDNLTYLFFCMKGNYSSEDQSRNDSDYYNIRLRMVPVWKKENDVFYLYVEQAMAINLEKPYRQRFYKVVKLDDTHFTSQIYLVNNPSRFTGKLMDDPIFNTITSDSLTLKEGCEVYLELDNTTRTFSGATKDKTCPSERSGASYATAKVTLNETELCSWDQGWGPDGTQVWGATKGGYIFKKLP